MQGLFLGIGEMRGLGLQHLHGMGFLMGRITGKDGLPVWSGPSYLEIASSRSGVGAGEISDKLLCISNLMLRFASPFWLHHVADMMQHYLENARKGFEMLKNCVWMHAGRIRTELVHILANDFTLQKFKAQNVSGSELALTDLGDDMTVEDVQEYIKTAQADNEHSYMLSLRAREGTTLSLLRLYGMLPADLKFAILSCVLHGT